MSFTLSKFYLHRVFSFSEVLHVNHWQTTFWTMNTCPNFYGHKVANVKLLPRFPLSQCWGVILGRWLDVAGVTELFLTCDSRWAFNQIQAQTFERATIPESGHRRNISKWNLSLIVQALCRCWDPTSCFMNSRPHYCNCNRCCQLWEHVHVQTPCSAFQIETYSWRFLVAIEANSNQRYTWTSNLTLQMSGTQSQTKDHGIISVTAARLVSLRVRRLWELSNLIFLLTQPTVNHFTDLTHFTKSQSSPLAQSTSTAQYAVCVCAIMNALYSRHWHRWELSR